MSLHTETNITHEFSAGSHKLNIKKAQQHTFKKDAEALFLICGSNNTGAYIWTMELLLIF